jgi:hypothetical protein
MKANLFIQIIVINLSLNKGKIFHNNYIISQEMYIYYNDSGMFINFPVITVTYEISTNVAWF